MRKIYLSRTDRKLLGVCGGIGEAYDIDPTLIRRIAVFLCIATAVLPLVITYLIGWLIIPNKPD
jgi:phage shock protein C